MTQNNDEFISREEALLLHRRFRDIKHDISNSLAVMMALSEMTQRRPEHAEKLCRAVLNKAPKIVEELQQFSQEFRALVNPPPDDSPLSSLQ